MIRQWNAVENLIWGRRELRFPALRQLAQSPSPSPHLSNSLLLTRKYIGDLDKVWHVDSVCTVGDIAVKGLEEN